MNEARVKEVKDITQRVMTAFTKFYIASLKDVMIEDIKEKRYIAAKKAMKDAKNAGKPVKPRRPRKKQAKPNRLSSKISYSYELDSGIDPYIVYAVTTEFGGEKVTTYKRYKQFKKFHDKWGKKVNSAKLPPPSSKFGSRDLSWDFRRRREKMLQEYVDAICADERSATNKDVLAFFRVGQNEDAVFRETFRRAYDRTRSYLWQWSWVVWDTEEEAIGRLVSEEVKRSMWSDVCYSFPPNATVRRKAMQVAWKMIQATVSPVVAAGWKVVRETVDKLKPAIGDAMSTALTPMVQLQADLQLKVNDVLAAGFAPIVDGVKGLVAPMAAQILPHLEEAVFTVAPAEKFVSYLNDIEAIVATEDLEKMKVIREEVVAIRNNIVKAVEEQLEKAIEPIVGDFKGKVSVDALLTLFDPINRLNQVGKNFFQFIDPANQFHVLEKLFEWKKKVKEAGREKVEETLDREEWDIDYWQVWRMNSNIRYSGWCAAWNLYQALPDSYSAVRVFENFVEDFAKLNERTFLDKFSFKFGDYLHEAAKTASTPEEFNAAVDQCFMIGYQRAVKHFNKHWMFIVVTNLRKTFRALFVDKITKTLLEASQVAIEPLAAMIVSPLDNLLDINTIVTKAIRENMDNLLDETISSIHPSLARGIAAYNALEPTEKQVWSTEPLPEEKQEAVETPASPPGSPKADS